MIKKDEDKYIGELFKFDLIASDFIHTNSLYKKDGDSNVIRYNHLKPSDTIFIIDEKLKTIVFPTSRISYLFYEIYHFRLKETLYIEKSVKKYLKEITI